MRKYYRTCNDCLTKIEELKKAKKRSKKVVRHICPDCGNWVKDSKFDLSRGKCIKCAAKFVWHQKPVVKKTKCKHCGKEFKFVGTAKWLCISCSEAKNARYVVLEYKDNDDHIIGKFVSDYPETIKILPFNSKGVLMDKVISLDKGEFSEDSLKPLTKLSFQRALSEVKVL